MSTHNHDAIPALGCLTMISAVILALLGVGLAMLWLPISQAIGIGCIIAAITAIIGGIVAWRML